MMRIIKVYKSASLGCSKERHSTTHFDRCPWADVVSLHQLNEERRVKSEEFDIWVHSTVRVRNEANIFSINFLNNFKLWVNLTKCFLAPLPWVRKRVKLFILFVLSEPKKANANLVKSIMPGFRPSFSVDRNGKRTYDLIPNRISLVKYSEDNDPNGDNNPTDKLRVGCD